jgi:hypothetical protein
MTVHVDRSLRLPAGEYFAQRRRKTGIAIHHTVCGAANTTIELWRDDRTPRGGKRRVATPYVIGRDGTVFEVFDPEHWAYHMGVRWPDTLRHAFEQRVIGIEIASEGGLIERDGILYAFDRVAAHTLRSKAQSFDYGEPYRGYRWFDRYEPAQLDALGRLVDDLCSRFPIPRRYPDRPCDYYGDTLAEFEGVIGHAMVRSDKSDPAPDPALWATLEDLARLAPTAVAPSTAPPPSPPSQLSPPLTRRDLDALFHENARRINAMSTAAGSMVKTLVLELQRRRVYLRLADPEPRAHSIEYSVAQGDARLVGRLARALGFKNVTDRLLEVRHA